MKPLSWGESSTTRLFGPRLHHPLLPTDKLQSQDAILKVKLV